jgi:hypothetical protein
MGSDTQPSKLLPNPQIVNLGFRVRILGAGQNPPGDETKKLAVAGRAGRKDYRIASTHL